MKVHCRRSVVLEQRLFKVLLQRIATIRVQLRVLSLARGEVLAAAVLETFLSKTRCSLNKLSARSTCKSLKNG